MKSFIVMAAACLLIFGTSFSAHAQEEDLSALDILNRVDDVMNGARDQKYTMRIVLIDKAGNEKSRELVMLQKGRDKRLARFLTPADQRGIAFLSLPGDVQYLYLPAFGKVRRIASHVKNTSFAGTDFTYEDMEAVRMSEKWDPRILRQEQDQTVLEMTPRPGKATDYSKVILWVRNDNFYPVRAENYGKDGALRKILVREKLQNVKGYWTSMETTMEDVRKQHKTRMLVSDMAFDTGIEDAKFTERALSQQ
jgi:outer membrane lipoprotein-sorting protein